MSCTGDQLRQACTDTVLTLGRMPARRTPLGSSRTAGRCPSFADGSGTPCTDTVRWSYYSQDRNLYWCHSGTVHRLEIPTNPWDTDDQSCAGSIARSGCLHSHKCIHGKSWASCGSEPHSHMDLDDRRQCSFSHNNRVHIDRCASPIGRNNGYELDRETRGRDYRHRSQFPL